LIIKDLPDKQWSLIHTLNGQLILELKNLLGKELRWNHKEWIITVLVLQRAIKETEEAVLKTSSTMLNGRIFDAKEKTDLKKGVGDLNRIVPLVNSFAGYCIRSGSILWADDIENHPLREEYRRYEYVNIHPDRKFIAEYVFPIRVKVGLNQTVVGALNLETSREENEFKKAGPHRISEIVLRLLDIHGPFLLLSEAVMADENVNESLLETHKKVLESTAFNVTKAKAFRVAEGGYE